MYERMITRLNNTNQEMLTLAKQDEWDKLLKLSSQRDLEIRKYFNVDNSLTEASEIKHVQSSVLKSDSIISQIIANKKKHMVSSSLKLKNSNHAINSYNKTQGK